MKKLLLMMFIANCFSCSKSSDPGTKLTYHISITSSSVSQKFMDLNDANKTPRITFSGNSYETDATYIKGTSIAISCGYSTANNLETIHLVLSKNGTVIKDETQNQRVDINVQSAQ